MESNIIELGAYRYVEEGEGTPLVLLHGLFGALSNFAEVRAHFSKSFRVITPMLPIYELPMLETNAKQLAKHITQASSTKWAWTRCTCLGTAWVVTWD